MSFKILTDPKGHKLVRVTTPEGKVFEFRKISTKPLDQKLKKETSERGKAMRDGFSRAVKRAKKKGVPLQKLIPVS